jgi:hypothetical protein
MRLVTFFLLLSLVSSNTFAQEAKYLTKDTPAPFTGFLITPEKAEKVREMDIDLRLTTKTNEILTKQNELLLGQVDSLSKKVVEARDDSTWNKIGYFIIGAGITGLLGYGIYRSAK